MKRYAAIVSVGLLVGDVTLPVPASGVMVANGALFGALAGAALGLAYRQRGPALSAHAGPGLTAS